MFCSNCGKEIENGAVFCRYCGAKAAPGAEAAFSGQEPDKRGSKRGMAWKLLCVVGIICVLSFLAVFLYISRRNLASSISMARIEGHIDILDKNGKDLSPVEDMKLYQGYQVDTQEESYAWLDLDSVKLAKMDEESRIQIRSSGKDLEVQVDSGNLYFHIREPLGDDETMNIRTSNMVVGIRGTCGWVEIPDENHMKVYILEGRVRCAVTEPGSGKEQRESVSAGEMAEMSLSEDNEGQIQTSRFMESDIPDFVRKELEKDEALSGKILDASGLDIESEELPEADPKAAFSEALSDLISTYGVFRTNQSGVMSTTQDSWMNPGGVISATILDFDLDGEEEMMVCYTEPSADMSGEYEIMLAMYEAAEGNAVLADKVPLVAYQEWNGAFRLSGNQWMDIFLDVNAVRANGRCYIMFEERQIARAFADGQDNNYWLMVYEDGKWNYAGSFTQDAIGSAGFSYTGYEFENGALVSSQVYYDEQSMWEGTSALYEDFSVAITEFFGKFGIRLISDVDLYGSDVIPMLADDNDKTAIFAFTNRLSATAGQPMAYQCSAILNVDSGSAVFDEAASVPDSDFSGSMPSSSDTVLSGESDYLLPDISSRYLTEEEVSRLSKEDLRLARNEVYARYGRLFNSPDLQDYFNSKSWYHGQIPADQFDESVLNDYERQNLDAIRKAEERIP